MADYLANIAMDTTGKPTLEYEKLLPHVRNDLQELHTAHSPADFQWPRGQNQDLQLNNPDTLERLLPSLLPLEVTSARREAKQECLTFPYRATLWRSRNREVSKQENERIGLQPAGIG